MNRPSVKAVLAGVNLLFTADFGQPREIGDLPIVTKIKQEIGCNKGKRALHRNK